MMRFFTPYRLLSFRFSLICLSLLFIPASSQAQNKAYEVPKMQMYVTIEQDGSASIDYSITYHNLPGSAAKEVVDIGTPGEHYDLQNVQAWIGKQRIPAGDIRRSTVLPIGFEVHFGSNAIPPGGTETLSVQFKMPRMVYQDTTRKDYASFRITPTWFNPNYIQGNTHLQIAVQLPKGVKPEEALSQQKQFSARAKTDRGTVVYWDFPATRMTEEHLVGVSFPKGDVPVFRQNPFDLLMKWFRESTQARFICGIVFLILFGILFFRFSGGTGFSVYAILSGIAVYIFYVSPGLHLLSLPLIVVLIGLNEWFLGKRKTKYMPPIAQVEGGGIKRGLTASEAAVLLELPLGKVLSLVIFGMLKKGILRQVRANPLTVELNEDFVPPKPKSDSAQAREGQVAADSNAMPVPAAARQEPRPPENNPPENDSSADIYDFAEPPPVSGGDQREKRYRETIQKMGSVIQAYESGFLFLIEHNPGEPVSNLNFTKPMRGLIQQTAAKMSGFDLKQTKDYYQSIVRRATEQAAAIGDIQQRKATIDRTFDWILMGDNYPTVFDFGGGYWPSWSSGSVFGGSSSMSMPDASSIPGTTSFGDVASSFAGWAENTMGSMASTVLPSSLGGGAASSGGGFLDLSGADRVTGEIFSALGDATSSGGSGGGGDFGGGCACAGCACACACAGGGR